MNDEALRALLVELLRRGAIPAEAVEDAAEDCDAAGQDQAAHELRCLVVRSECSRPSEWVKAQADRRAAERRTMIRPIDGGKIDT